MYSKILVALDSSEITDSILLYVRYLALNFTTELHFLLVRREAGQGSNQDLRSPLEHLERRLQQEGIRASVASAYGDPAEEILEYCEIKKISLIVMSVDRGNGYKRWFLGSTAQSVGQRTTVPVLMIPSRDIKNTGSLEDVTFSRILVPLDGSEDRETVLPHVVTIAEKLGSSITLLHVVVPPTRGVPVMHREVERMSRVVGEAYIEKVKRRLKERGISIDSQIADGSATKVILQFAKEGKFGLIAMTTQGLIDVLSHVFGSVSNKVIYESEVPVLFMKAI
jgi:nucleotide-binding universal stress UspA family protein